MKPTKTLEDYKNIIYTILTNLSESITYSQLTTLIQEILCIENYTEISAAINNLVYTGFLHEITAPYYLVELATRKRANRLTPTATAINKKLIELILEAKKSSPDYDYCYTDNFPIPIHMYFTHLRQYHLGLLKCNQAKVLIARMDYYCDGYLKNTIDDDITDFIQKFFKDNKSKLRLKDFNFDRKNKTFTLTLYLLPNSTSPLDLNKMKELISSMFVKDVTVSIQTENL